MKTETTRRAVMPALNDDAFRLEDFLPYKLSVAANRVSRLFARRYSEAYGLSIPEWRVLAMVGRFGTLSPSAVGEWTAMDKVKVIPCRSKPGGTRPLEADAGPEGRARPVAPPHAQGRRGAPMAWCRWRASLKSSLPGE